MLQLASASYFELLCDCTTSSRVAFHRELVRRVRCRNSTRWTDAVAVVLGRNPNRRLAPVELRYRDGGANFLGTWGPSGSPGIGFDDGQTETAEPGLDFRNIASWAGLVSDPRGYNQRDLVAVAVAVVSDSVAVVAAGHGIVQN